MLRAVLVLAVAAAATAQYVSPYAVGWHRFPGVLPQYLSGSSLDNRQGEVVSQYDLETRVSQLPPDRQPFWYVNKEVLEAIKHQQVPVPATTPAARFRRAVLRPLPIA
ncbi:uncharacterized protein LOC126471609 [Schistocerca serialis cubense]|uniref:uncharacterized protein LOC126249702 n=1 Tax=Schistocerca nitens TaxID=7011 RepID=UPI0021188DAD|nr:uncharacterized protein LOC126249702 [Schistocerca nitens]XP_049955804.1 uncharacterized protein LOC126471609 [Schistocerca serialis cubense]